MEPGDTLPYTVSVCHTWNLAVCLNCSNYHTQGTRSPDERAFVATSERTHIHSAVGDSGTGLSPRHNCLPVPVAKSRGVLRIQSAAATEPWPARDTDKSASQVRDCEPEAGAGLRCGENGEEDETRGQSSPL